MRDKQLDVKSSSTEFGAQGGQQNLATEIFGDQQELNRILQAFRELIGNSSSFLSPIDITYSCPQADADQAGRTGDRPQSKPNSSPKEQPAAQTPAESEAALKKGAGSDSSLSRPEVWDTSGARAPQCAALQQLLLAQFDKFGMFPASPEGVKRAAEFARTLRAEQEKGEFGPASQQAYAALLRFFENGVPNVVAELCSCGLGIPPGGPLQLQRLSGFNGRPQSPESMAHQLATGERHFSLGITADHFPREKEWEALTQTARWLAECNACRKAANDRLLDASLERAFSQYGFPEAWKRHPDEDPARWRAAASSMIDLAVAARNSVEVMHALLQMTDESRGFPFSLPPGSALVVKRGDKTYELTDQDLANPSTMSLLRDKRTQLLDVKLPLPADLRLDRPENEARIEALRTWMAENSALIEGARGRLGKYSGNPEALMMYGDMPVPPGFVGRFNAKTNEFLGLVRKDAPAKPGEDHREISLISCDYEVKLETSGPLAGQYTVVQTVRAANSPWYAYQDCRWLGTEYVGQPMQLRHLHLQPGDWVPIRDGEKVRLVKASDLQGVHDRQRLCYWGEKTVVAAMDTALLVWGTLEARALYTAAARGAKLAECGIALTDRELLMQGAKTGLKMGVAVTADLNNSGVNHDQWGSRLNQARNLYFLGDIGLSLTRFARAAAGLGKAGSVAERLEAIKSGLEGTSPQASWAGLPWSRRLEALSNPVFRTAEVVVAGAMGADLVHELQRAREGGRDPMKRIVAGTDVPEAASAHRFDLTKPEVRAATEQTLDHYSQLLTAGRSEATQSQVRRILERTKELLKPGDPASAEAKAAFTRELFAKMIFAPEEIEQLERAHPGPPKNFQFSQEQLLDLLDPTKRSLLPPTVRVLADSMMRRRDPDVIAAAHIALLYLSRKADGSVSLDGTNIELTVPRYEKSTVTSRGEKVVEFVSEQRTFSLSLTPKQLALGLWQDATAQSNPLRELAATENLYALGAVTEAEYLRSLQLVAGDKTLPAECRLTFLRGLTAICSTPAGNAEGVFEQRGTTHQETVRHLELLAGNDSEDPTMRAFAAAAAFALKVPDAARRARLIQELAQAAGAKPVNLAQASDILGREMCTTKQGNDAQEHLEQLHRLKAARALAAISTGDVQTQAAINRTLLDAMKSSSLEVFIRATELLTPGRLQEAWKSDPAVAQQLLDCLLSHVHKPTTADEATIMPTLIQRCTELAGASEQTPYRALLKESLLQCLVPDRQNPYADLAETRIAAIKALAQLGSQEAVPFLLRSMASTAIRNGDKYYLPEPNPLVRAAAAEALGRLGSRDFFDVLPKLLDSETDPAVSRTLWDAYSGRTLIDPTDRGYQQQMEQTEDALREKAGPCQALLGMKPEEVHSWLEQNFPLVTSDGFQKAVNEAVDAATKWTQPPVDWFTGVADSIFRWANDGQYQPLAPSRIGAQDEAFHTVRLNREQQIQALLNGALGDSERALVERRILLELIRQPTIVTTNGVGNVQTTKREFPNGDISPIQLNAAKTLARCAKEAKNKDYTAILVKQALDTPALPENVRQELLAAWKELAFPQGGSQPALSREEYALVLLKALQKVTTEATQNSPAIQIQLMEELTRLRYRPALSQFEAISHASSDQAVKNKATECFSRLQPNAIGVIWEDTVPDTTSSAAQRFATLQSTLDSTSSDAIVTALFKACKGYKFGESREDLDSVNLLRNLLSHNNERVRLAAAQCLIESLPPDNPLVKMAFLQCAELATSSKRLGVYDDAHQLLSKCPYDRPISCRTQSGEEIAIEPTPAGPTVKVILNGKVVARAMPGGGAYRFFMQGDVVVAVLHDGELYTRQSAQGKYLDEWHRSRDSAPFYGDFRCEDDCEVVAPRGSAASARAGDGAWRAWPPSPPATASGTAKQGS